MYYAINAMKSQATLTPVQIKENSLYQAKNFVFSPSPTSTLLSPTPLPRQKILYIITQGVWGGTQHYILDLATELSKYHDVTVAIGEPNGPRDLQKKLEKITPNSKNGTLHIVQLQHLRRAINPFHDILALFELKNLYHTIAPHRVHLNSTKAGILGSLATLLGTFHFRLIYTVHGWIFLEPLSPLVKKLFTWLEQKTMRFKDLYILLSPEEKNIGQNTLHIPESKISVIPLGIALPEHILSQNEARQKLRSYTQTQLSTHKWVGTIAGLYKTKNLDGYINTIARDKELQQNIHYFIIGEGPEHTALQHLIDTHHLEDIITLTGHIDEASQLLPAFDVFVLPSKKEGLPYVLLESMSYNLPIVATSVGGVRSLLSAYTNATVVAPHDSTELSRAIQERLSSPIQTSLVPVQTLSTMVASTLHAYSSLG